MRTPRIAIVVLFFVASIFLFCRSVSSSAHTSAVVNQAAVPRSRFTTFFSFTAPFSIFTPNAAISLTDDNSTSFVARPAAFGPNLPSKGLSGQLWIGSGFADDNLQEGEGEGELGCSDIPGWEDGKSNVILKSAAKDMSKADTKAATAAGKPGHHKRDKPGKDAVPDAVIPPGGRLKSKIRPLDDGTDDYLHQGLARKPQPNHDSALSTESTHADIQSIQEAAEIAGKIVLLSRGGCGFLEKVKWAQRRGAIALIVGDNMKGGPLIQMFARGDTSNVTIPSVFTARTTAHLLSSLTQPGSFIEDTIDEHGRPALKVLQSDGTHRKNRKKQKAAATTPTSTPKPTATPKAKASKKAKPAETEETKPRVGWIRWLFTFGHSSRLADGSIQPPSSGRHNWVLVDDWSEEKDKVIRDGLGKAAKRGKSKAADAHKAEDSFQIGVQDWRDPDLVDAPMKEKENGPNKDSGNKVNQKNGKDVSGPKGGSITPGSGEYNPDLPAADGKTTASAGKEASHGGLMSKIFGDDDSADPNKEDKSKEQLRVEEAIPDDDDENPPVGHDGLWVTITPASSSSPFFDTLLVLVISPLITLSIVYALLILRARIRRRRWRAPKSVVERLPVRTYHTVAASPVPSPRIPSPTSATPTTPLLQQTPTRPRPRSRTTTGIPESESLLSVNSALQMPRSPSRAEHEKANGSYSSEWRKYMGRQVECVVCLEEYVDGVSRVMSLPCGHEFHAECITPWLTTRRRTCPICKGDVVRSLARGSPSSPRYEAYHDDSEDEVEAEGSGSRDRDDDPEQGILSPAPRGRQNGSEGWLGMLSNSFGSSSRSSRPPQEDRNR
ncbi:E3 ubiquitin-protein ligase RNF13 [Colletotrichum orbiculare MAFF 240422]|uniref:E3 ubiquitin-protein ligase RNF13 n=1 Tax=Colletotrichum orbiculare (strain 104-T / ATCC 96160 / CBS 514.97 / LARS 414 / MAFF 240422) TaxID=1213857 RepID=N4V5L1_COLOR|nr:E3 ubiquitin-protein ligase RNF13 [Colletotrichum orbiculare MAFF 240422]